MNKPIIEIMGRCTLNSNDINGESIRSIANDNSIHIKNCSIAGYMKMATDNTKYMLIENVEFKKDSSIDIDTRCERVAFLNCNFNNIKINFLCEEYVDAPEILIFGLDTTLDIELNGGDYAIKKLWVYDLIPTEEQRGHLLQYLKNEISGEIIDEPVIIEEASNWSTTLLALGAVAVGALLINKRTAAKQAEVIKINIEETAEVLK